MTNNDPLGLFKEESNTGTEEKKQGSLQGDDPLGLFQEEGKEAKPQGFQKSTDKDGRTVVDGYEIPDPYAKDNPGEPISNPFSTFAETVKGVFQRIPSSAKTTEGMFESLSLSRARELQSQIIATQSASYDPEARQYLNQAKSQMNAMVGGNIKDEDIPELLDKVKERIQIKEQAVSSAVNYAISRNANLNQKEMVDRLSEISNPMDFVNYIASATGEAIAQIPLSIVTFGASSFVQSAGESYLNQVQDIATKNNISVEEVIQKGLDDPAIAAANAGLAASLDRAGAGKIHKLFTKNFLKNQFRRKTIDYAQSVGTESVTEGIQTGLEQRGAKQSLNFAEIGEAMVKGGIGAGVISTPSVLKGQPVQEDKTTLSPAPAKETIENIDTEKERTFGESQAKFKREVEDITSDLDEYLSDEIEAYDKAADDLALEINPEEATELEIPEQNDPVGDISVIDDLSPLSALKEINTISQYEDVVSWAEENGIKVRVQEDIPNAYGSFSRNDPMYINLNKSTLNNQPKKLVDQVIAHEVVHSMVDRGLRNASTRNAVWGELTQLKSTYLDAKPLEGAPQGVIDMMETIQDENRLGEIITYAMTDPEVAKWMDGIEVAREEGSDQKTLWASIKQSIRKLAESIGVSGTALDKVGDILDQYVSLSTQAEIKAPDEVSPKTGTTPKVQEEVQTEATEIAPETTLEENINQPIEEDVDTDRVLDLMAEDEANFASEQETEVDQSISPELKAERDEMMQDVANAAAVVNRTTGKKGKEFLGKKFDRMVKEYNQFAEDNNIQPLTEEQVNNIRETGKVLEAQPKTDLEETSFDLPEDQLMKARTPVDTAQTIVNVANKLPGKLTKDKFSQFVARANSKLGSAQKISPEVSDKAWALYNDQTEADSLSSIKKDLLKKTDPNTYRIKGSAKLPKGKSVAVETINKLEEIRGVMIDMSREDAHQEVQYIFQSAKNPDATMEELTDSQLDRIDVLSFADINSMDKSQLEYANKAIDSLIKEGKTLFKKRQANKKELVEDIKGKIADVISGGKGVVRGGLQSQALLNERSRKAVSSVVNSKFFTKMDAFDHLLDKLSYFDKGSKPLESALNRLVGDMVQNAQEAENAGLVQASRQIEQKVTEIFGKKSYKQLVRNSTEFTDFSYTDLEGNPSSVRMTPNQAYKRWMEAQDPSHTKSFEEEGIDRVEFAKSLEKQLDPKLIKWARWQLEEFYPKYWESINKVYTEEFGYNLPKNEFYSPTAKESEVDSDNSLLAYETPMETVLNNSLFTRKNSSAPLAIQDGDQVLARYISKMEHFKAWQKPVSIMRKTIQNKDIRRTIELYHGKGFNVVLDSFVNDWARGGSSKEQAIGWMDGLRKNMTTAVIGLNFTVYLKQLASIPAYAAEIPVASFAKGHANFWKNPNKAIKTLSSIPYVQARMKVGYDRDVAFATEKGSNRMLSGKSSIRDRGMFLTKYGDMAAIYAGGWPVYKYHYDKTLKATGSKAKAEKEATFRFIKATKLSQQSSNIGELSFYQRGNSAMKLFTMFMSAPLLYFQHTQTAIRNLRAGRGSKVDNIKRLAMYHVVLPFMFQLMSNGFSELMGAGDMEEEEREDLYWKWAKQSMFGSLNGVLFAGPLVEHLFMGSLGHNFKYSETFLGGLSYDAIQVWKVVTKVVDDSGDMTNEDWYNALADISDLAGKLSGYPIPSVRRHTESAYQSYMREDLPAWDRFLLALGYSEYAIGANKKK